MKRVDCLIVPVLFVLAFAPLLRADEETDKTEVKLDGSWLAKHEDREITLTFNKGKFSLTIPSGRTLKGTYKVDTSKKPNELDMTVTEGDPQVVGDVALCIYELKGETMKWCANDPDEGNPRAKEFPEKQGDQGGDYMYLIFKRVKE